MVLDPTVTLDTTAVPGSGHALVTVRGEIDLATLSVFQSSFARAVDAAPVVVVDLDEVGYLSAAGVRFLVKMRVAKETRGGALLLRCDEHRPARLVLRALGVPVGGRARSTR